jgi:hypothetical protein
MIEKFGNIILYLDVLGKTPQFNINGRSNYPSYLGSCLTLALATIIVVFFFIFSLKIIVHSEPKIVYTTYVVEDPDMIKFTNEFILTLGLQFPNYTNFLDESIYYIKAYSVTTKYDKQLKAHINYEEPINFMKCSEYKFSVLKEYFNELPIQNLYCFNLTNYEIGGEFSKNIWKIIRIEFHKCLKSNEYNYTCQNESTVEEYLSNGYMGGFLTDYFILSNNYSHPIQIYGKNVYTSFEYNKYFDYWIYFKSKSIKTDRGLIFTDYKEISGITFDRVFETKIVHQSKSILGSFILRLSTNKDSYERNYLKLHEAIAEIGGFIKACFILGDFLSKFFRDTLYKNFILQFFNLDEDKTIQELIHKKNINLKKNYSNSLNHNISNIPLNNLNSYIQTNLLTNIKNEKKTNNSSNNLIGPKKIKFNEDKTKQTLNNNYFNNHFKIIANIDESEVKTKNQTVKDNSKKIMKYLNNNSILKNNDENKKKRNENEHNNTDNNFAEQNNNYLSSSENNVHPRHKSSGLNSFAKIEHRLITKSYCFLQILCKSYGLKRVYVIKKEFEKIYFIFDIVQYIKLRNEFNYIQKLILNEDEKRELGIAYHFDYDLHYDKEGYDYLFHKKKNNVGNIIKNKIMSDKFRK